MWRVKLSVLIFKLFQQTMIIVQNYRLSDWISIFNGYQPLED